MQITPQYFVYFGLLLIILELIIGVSTGFDLLLSGILFIIGGGIFWLTNIFWLSVVSTLLLIALYFIIFRKSLRSKFIPITTRKTNIDKLAGAEGVVVKNISKNKPGQIKVEGEVWRASSNENIQKGETAFVKSVEGVTLKVSKKGGTK